MRSPSARPFRPRRVLALAGLVSLAGGLLMLPGLAHPGRAAASAAAAPAAAGASCGPGTSGTAVTGPMLWDPAHGRPLPTASCVTVDQTSNLVNQMVQVNWYNFTPSSAILYGPTSVFYPVMIAECAGTSPASSADCYGAQNGGVTGGSGPFGPMNTVYMTTAPNGTGVADIQIETATENQFLGCDQNHPCSLVVVPAQGGDVFKTPPDCADHSLDEAPTGGTAWGQLAFSANFGSCSWADRIVIPLSFAPAPSVCPLKNAAFTAAGSPMLARAMNSWVAGLCTGSHGLTIQYNSQIPEPLAVQEAVGGLTDVALTTRPASAQSITPTRHYLYAPVAVSAVSIAYWVDDPATGLPVTSLKLDQRLVLKLITQSYNFQNEGVPCSAPPPPAGIGCDNAVDGNPVTLFADKEFQSLNPAVQPVQGLGAAFQVPTVQSGHSDMTWFVTRWIEANSDAASFLSGQFDPWGMHVNTDYEGLAYPTDAFTAQDSYPVIEHRFSPVFPLSLAAAYQVQNWEPGTSWVKDQFGNYPKDPIQPPGQRALFAILDQGDSAAFRFPVAAIPNGTGHYVLPTNSAMAAALQGMQSDGSGTQQVNLASKNTAAYPLTMVIYAMVPTSGTKHKTAAAIARFLDYAAGVGQKQGVQPGQLPPGYLPLPASMAATTRKDATAVLHQTGATSTPKTNTTNPGLGSGASPAPSATTSPGGSVSLPGVGPSNGGQPISMVPVAHVSPATITRYALPALLILGGLAALAGSSSLVGSAPAETAARLRRLRQGSLALARKARLRAGLRRKS
jgi:ABC-type phosphate transport system substrate-binding protein